MDVEAVRRNWGWFLALGVAQVVLGLVALGEPVLVTFFAVWMFGWPVLFSGVAHGVHLFAARSWSGAILDILGAVLGIVVGVFMITNPVQAAVDLTLVLAVFLTAGGLTRILAALTLPFRHRGLVALSGVITLVLGILVWRHWPTDSLWFIGLCVCIDLVFYGWWWIFVALTARQLTPPGTTAPERSTAATP